MAEEVERRVPIIDDVVSNLEDEGIIGERVLSTTLLETSEAAAEDRFGDPAVDAADGIVLSRAVLLEFGTGNTIDDAEGESVLSTAEFKTTEEEAALLEVAVESETSEEAAAWLDSWIDDDTIFDVDSDVL